MRGLFGGLLGLLEMNKNEFNYKTKKEMKIELNKPIKEVEANVIDLAKALAKADDREQAMFFDAFNKALLDTCGDAHGRDLQIIAFCDQLESSGKDLINNIHGFMNIPD